MDRRRDGIDSVLALCLVPIIGSLSDATRSRWGRRVPFILIALPVTAIAVWRARFVALLAELVPSVHRSKTEGILSVAMGLAAMMVLGGARSVSERRPDLPFVLAACW